jgi:hypothetical protein
MWTFLNIQLHYTIFKFLCLILCWLTTEDHTICLGRDKSEIHLFVQFCSFLWMPLDMNNNHMLELCCYEWFYLIIVNSIKMQEGL